MEFLLKINKEETIQYLLGLIDQLITEHPETIKLFMKLGNKKQGFPMDPFIRILTRSTSDWFTNAKTSNILAIFMSQNGQVNEQTVKFMCQWLRSQLRSGDEKEVANAVIALMKFLRKDEYRSTFATEDGLLLLASLLKTKNKSYQLTYQTLHCLWLLSYNKQVANQVGGTKVINFVVDILRTIQKEKIIRMCLAILNNFKNINNNNEQMLDSGISKPLDILSNKQWGDEDIDKDLDELKKALETNLQALSSFDIYRTEVVSGNLEWSPVHKSERFWKENSHKFEEDNYKVLLLLKQYITSETPNSQVASIACYDLGEFARIHPRGRNIIQQLGIKIPLMALMEDKDPEIRKQALTAIQKLMVHNWEYLNM